MADEKNLNEELEAQNENDVIDEEVEIVTLTDEEGNESDFEVIGELVVDGTKYMAFMAIEGDNDEYVVLRCETDEDGELSLVTIDDDDEFDKVSDAFDDVFRNEIDYDAE